MASNIQNAGPVPYRRTGGGQPRQMEVKGSDSVKSGDILAEIETDKADNGSRAIDEGTVGQIAWSRKAL